MSWLSEIVRFHEVLDLAKGWNRWKRTLSGCHARMPRPKRGVYFFFDPGEFQTEPGYGLQIVRVGTQGVPIGLGFRRN